VNDIQAVSADISATPDRILVGILTGSPNDLPIVVKVRDTLTELGIKSEIIVASAHRTGAGHRTPNARRQDAFAAMDVAP
jgi:phosphoribosylcarboxyaminoimidazole (NCAIR) mutase